MLRSQPWYEVVEGAQLQQGDLLRAFLIAKPPKNIEVGADGVPRPSPSKVENYDIVVLTQSCDLVNSKTGTVLVCPHMPLEEAGELAPRHIRENPESLLKFYEQIRRGNQPNLHMLSASRKRGLEGGVRVVDFRYAAFSSLAFANRMAEQVGPRLRLRSPYVEHLSQAFGRFFMRVGLPTDIPGFSSLP